MVTILGKYVRFKKGKESTLMDPVVVFSDTLKHFDVAMAIEEAFDFKAVSAGFVNYGKDRRGNPIKGVEAYGESESLGLGRHPDGMDTMLLESLGK